MTPDQMREIDSTLGQWKTIGVMSPWRRRPNSGDYFEAVFALILDGVVLTDQLVLTA